MKCEAIIMGLFDYEQARKTYKSNKVMSSIIDGLEDMDQYHLLRDNGVFKSSGFELPNTAEEFKTWLGVCDGGLLFSTTILGFDDYDEELGISFSTLQEWNTKQKHELLGLSEGYFVIALLNYGDPVCLSSLDSRIYLWDTSEMAFTTIWESFADFLADEYNTAVQMVDDEALESVPMKMEEQDGQ